ncbi:MAG: Ig-like domain-containing protein, partial [Mobilitalea sp.]
MRVTGVFYLPKTRGFGAITVTGTGGATTITADNGTLQMLAAVLPVNATNSNVTWAVTNVTGSAIISATGLLTAVTNGTVTVKATSVSSGTVYGTAVITISGQLTAATFTAAGDLATHDGTTYIRYALTLTEDGTQINLGSTDITSMTIKNPDNTITQLDITIDPDPFLYFYIAMESGTYTFTITTVNGTVYTAIITYTDADAAGAVDTLIAALPAAGTVALTDQTQIEEARAAYEALTPARQALVTKVAALDAAEAELLVLTDAAEAGAVDTLITALPAAGTVALTDQTQIEEARAAYEALTPAQQALVDATA